MTKTKDFWAGVIFAIFGAAFLLLSRHLPLGTATRMGPAYFPVVLGSLLTITGLAIAGSTMRGRGETLSKAAIMPSLLIIAAIVSFVLLIRDVGIIIAVVVAVILASLAKRPVDWAKVLGLAAGLAVLCAAIFVYGLGMPIPVFPPLIARWI